jgi:nucleotide-binding universal stress UspA family protein
VLLSEAAGEGALLVMGAYGRWRWQEWVFGGVTRHVLHHTPVPVLMAH